MGVKKVYDDGQVFGAEILDISNDSILKSFQKTISNVAAVSLASGYVTKPAMPHLILNAFKNLAGVSFDSDYSFKQAQALKDAAKNQVAAPVAAASGASKAAPAKEEKPKEEEVEVDADMGGLFGDDGY
jgi:large subunit ribosomal protein LP0